MKRATPCLLVLTLLLVAAPRAAADADEPISWETSYAAAIRRAEESGKPLLFKFYTGWCPHCTRMDRTTWRDDDVAELAESFVSAKVNADVEKVPVRRYRLTGYPSVIVAEPGGEEVLRLEGYKDARVVAAYLQAFLRHAEAVTEAHAALRADRRDAEARIVLGDFYRTVGLHESAAEHYTRATRDADGPTLETASARAGASLVHLGDFREACRILRPVARDRAEGAGAELLLALGRAEAGLGNHDAARAAWNRLVSRHPDSSEAAEARQGLAEL